MAATDGAPEPLLRFYDQDVSWRECRADRECASIEVPLDYDDPEGEAITLSLLRVPAEDSDRRIGSLVVNPGGPGVSGVTYAADAETYFGEELREVFDIVGFDPRGVSESTPIDCRTDEELDAYIGADPDPDTAAERREARALFAAFGEGCLERSGDADAPRLHRGGRPRPRRHPGRAGAGEAQLLRRVLRHPHRRDVRRPLPRPGRPAGARRRGRPHRRRRWSRPRSRPAASRPR